MVYLAEEDLTHINHRLLELDVEPVVGHGDDGVLRSPHVLRELAVQLGEGNLAWRQEENRTQNHQNRSLHFDIKVVECMLFNNKTSC